MASDSPPRLPAFVSTSAMLLLSVAVLLSVEQIRPVVRELQRETAVEREAVRQLAGHLARAVRGLSGADQRTTPHRLGPARLWARPSTITLRPPGPADLPGALYRPRDALLNLPPPATC
jgi:hypothetical protein